MHHYHSSHLFHAQKQRIALFSACVAVMLTKKSSTCSLSADMLVGLRLQLRPSPRQQAPLLEPLGPQRRRCRLTLILISAFMPCSANGRASHSLYCHSAGAVTLLAIRKDSSILPPHRWITISLMSPVPCRYPLGSRKASVGCLKG